MPELERERKCYVFGHNQGITLQEDNTCSVGPTSLGLGTQTRVMAFHSSGEHLDTQAPAARLPESKSLSQSVERRPGV